MLWNFSIEAAKCQKEREGERQRCAELFYKCFFYFQYDQNSFKICCVHTIYKKLREINTSSWHRAYASVHKYVYICVLTSSSRITWRSTQRTQRNECVCVCGCTCTHSIHNSIHSSGVDCNCDGGDDCRHILSVCLFCCCQFSCIFCHQRRHALKLIAYDVGAGQQDEDEMKLTA